MDDQDVSLKNLLSPLTTRKVIVFLFLAAFLVNFYSLFNSFVGDDNALIVNNPRIRDIANIPSFFIADRLNSGGTQALGSSYYRPVLDSIYSLVYAPFGPNAFVLHSFQLILYVVCAIAVFLLLKHFFKPIIAFLLAFLYVLHPINSEVILYISALQEILFFLFGMIALLIVIYKIGWRWMAASALFLGLSLLSKETGVLFIVVTLLYSLLYKRKAIMPTVIGGVAVVVLYLFLRIHANGLLNTDVINAPIQRLGLMDRLVNIPEMALFYVATFLFPARLSSSYQWLQTTITFEHFYIPLIILCLIMSGSLFFALFLRKSSQARLFRTYLFFLVWGLAGLVLHMQILPLDQTVAERWFFFPIVGFIGILGVVVAFSRINPKNPIVVYSLVLVCILFATRTFIRGTDYRDDFTLATRDVKVSPEAYNLEYQISHEYYMQGRLLDAKKHAIRSTVLFPYITNYTNLGAIYSRLGEYENAKKAYLEALKYGDDALPYENLAALAMVHGDADEDVVYLKEVALRKYPENGTIWMRYAIVLYSNGYIKEAKNALVMAEKQSPKGTVDFMKEIIKSGKKLNVVAENGTVRFELEN